MTLEKYIKSLPWGMRAKLAEYLKVSRVSVSKYGKRKDDPERITPSPNTAKLIESFSQGEITIEDILGYERATELKAIWSDHD